MTKRMGVYTGGLAALAALAMLSPDHLLAAVVRKPLDFDGDGKTDVTVIRNIGGGPSGQVMWFYSNSTGDHYVPWGLATDIFVPLDYDGDGMTDVAVWRPGPPGTAAFYILQSSTGTLRVEVFGQTGDDPSVTADYDGDGKADVAVYRPGATAGAQSFWYYRGSLNNPAGNVTYVPWGLNGDFPAPGNYDGDGKADFAIQRNAGGGQARFWLNRSTAGIATTLFGTPTDVIVPGDYDGDGKTDLAVVRGISGQKTWFFLPSLGGAIVQRTWGLSSTDQTVQGDYDGDGKTDLAIWRPNADPTLNFFWWLRSLDGGVVLSEWGMNGDYPAANYNSH